MKSIYKAQAKQFYDWEQKNLQKLSLRHNNNY